MPIIQTIALTCLSLIIYYKRQYCYFKIPMEVVMKKLLILFILTLGSIMETSAQSCQSNTTCPSGQICIFGDYYIGNCGKQPSNWCEKNSDCKQGDVCWSISGSGHPICRAQLEFPAEPGIKS